MKVSYRDAARAYAARGLRVFPLHPIVNGRCACKDAKCKDAGKHPAVKWGDGATTDPSQIDQWWSRRPERGIGIATGARSGVVVIDVDPRHGGDATIATFDVPPTYTVATGGGGRHLYFAHPGGKVADSEGKLGSGIDVRGDGGFVVAPPSPHVSGGVYSILNERPFAPLPNWALNGAAPRKVISEGGRNAFLASEAGRLRSLGLNDADLLTRLLAINGERCSPPLDDEEVAKVAASIARYSAGYTLDEVGNAQRLRDRNGFEIGWTQSKKWLTYDGRRWNSDVAKGMVVRRLHAMTQEMMIAAAQEPDEKKAKALFAWARASRSDAKVRGTLEQLSHLKGIETDDNAFDADPWALNVLNGTLDLRTGELRPHRSADRITRLAPVVYDPRARSPTWERYLRETTGGNAELLDFLQRIAGYGLTGDTREEKLFFLYGDTASGKSTFVDAMSAALGNYAMTTDFGTFVAKKGDSGIRNDLARLNGPRFVSSIEVDQGKKLAEAVVKSITGGDTISARFLHREFFDFRPKFKLYLVANHRPGVSDNDNAIWRRILIVPFEHVVPPDRRDPRVKEELRSAAISGAAVLAWAMKGCLLWQRDGLGIPPSVNAATQEYREAMNPLGDFLAELVEFRPQTTVAKTALWNAYQAWTATAGIRYPMTRHDFNSRIGSYPGVSEREVGHQKVRSWEGIFLDEKV